MTTWTELAKPIIGKLKVGQHFGSVTFNSDGCHALAALLHEMTDRLDAIASCPDGSSHADAVARSLDGYRERARAIIDEIERRKAM